MIVGITGTRKQPSSSQLFQLEEELTLRNHGVLLHGDCVGVDALAHDFARTEGYIIEVYPPDVDTYRAWRQGDTVYTPRPYRDRNQIIVDRCELLVAVPEGLESQHPRSGTWMTVRMARRAGKQLIVILPESNG